MAEPIDIEPYLQQARHRGEGVVRGLSAAAGMNHLVAYAGLVQSAIELAKIVKTEERDLKAIETYYEVEKLRLTQAFQEVDLALKADFARDATMQHRMHDVIDQLVASGHHDMAMAFFDRMIAGFAGSALDKIIAKQATLGINRTIYMGYKLRQES